jgi:hypothetical protein
MYSNNNKESKKSRRKMPENLNFLRKRSRFASKACSTFYRLKKSICDIVVSGKNYEKKYLPTHPQHACPTN